MSTEPQVIPRRVIVIGLLTLLHDAILGAMAFTLALLLRLGDAVAGPLLAGEFNLHTATFAVLTAGFSWMYRMDARMWRYSSIPELLSIVNIATLTVLSFASLMFLLTRLDTIPRSTLVISWCLIVLMLSVGRFAYRIWRNRRARLSRFPDGLKPVVLIGAGSESETFIKTASETSKLPYQIVAAFDERNRNTGQVLRGVRIIGSLNDLRLIVERQRLAEMPLHGLIVTKQHHTLQRAWFDKLLNFAAENDLRLLHIPDIASLKSGDGIAAPHPLRIENLLDRRQSTLEVSSFGAIIDGQTVVVTGAGGSIGSELCRQVMRLKPRRLVLFDNSEPNLVQIERELREFAQATEVVSRILDVRESGNVLRSFKSWMPKIVFHAAALKHIPVVEIQPVQGVHTNFIGTRNVADASLACGAAAMVMISTDKVVNPTSVMGATKRLAELYCQSLDLKGLTRFITVRFGNVMGSSGSVVPLFEKQVAKGGPVTVTHPQVTRYFMTIPEAAQLILHALHVGLDSGTDRGRIFVLDMGEPIKILDLARRMILLSGLQPDVDIAIEFTGLRQGEKLYEELFDEGEQLMGTSAESVLLGSPETRPYEEMAVLAQDCEQAIASDDAARCVELMRAALPNARLTALPGQRVESKPLPPGNGSPTPPRPGIH